MTNKDTPVFIISYNRLRYLRRLVEWLESAGFCHIHIVDNASTYQPLLEYLTNSPHEVHRLEKNYGHMAVWNCGLFESILRKQFYIVTDNDILPVEECPRSVTDYFFGVLEQYPGITKVGFALKIDDLPEQYSQRDTVIEWEKQFWKKQVREGLYDASIDTTFALYRPGIYPAQKKWWRSIRTDSPYVARHLPWYEDSGQSDEEDQYYQSQLINQSSFWSVTDISLLQRYQAELLVELKLIYGSRKWKILQLVYSLGALLFSSNRFQRRIGQKRNLFDAVKEDVYSLQRRNNDLMVEIGSIKSSDGWRILERLEKLFGLDR